MTFYLLLIIKGFLYEVIQFLSKSFDMKNMGDASYVIDIKIQRDRVRRILDLSQEAYINKVLERIQMKDCSPSIVSIVNKYLIFHMLPLLEA